MNKNEIISMISCAIAEYSKSAEHYAVTAKNIATEGGLDYYDLAICDEYVSAILTDILDEVIFADDSDSNCKKILEDWLSLATIDKENKDDMISWECWCAIGKIYDNIS